MSKEPETYIYNNGKGALEVVLTGRRAERRSRKGTFALELVEITPVDATNGSWKKWVSLKELFKIV